MTERTAIFMKCLNPHPLSCESRSWVVEGTFKGTDETRPKPVYEMDGNCPTCHIEGLQEEWGPVKPDTTIDFGPGRPFIPISQPQEAA